MVFVCCDRCGRCGCHLLDMRTKNIMNKTREAPLSNNVGKILLLTLKRKEKKKKKKKKKREKKNE